MSGNLGTWCAWWLALLLVSGCGPRGATPPSSTANSASASAQLSADEVLSRLVQTYREATHYDDQGEIRLEYQVGRQSHVDRAPFRVQFARPDTLSVQAYQTEIQCEQRRLLAALQDAGTQNLDQQFLSREIGSPLTLATLLEDLILGDALTQGLGRLPIQLELLLSDQALAGFQQPGTTRRLLEPRPYLDARCYRLEVTTAEGAFVLWIDEQEFVLRQLEFPESMAAARLPADFPPVALRLVAEFRGAKFAPGAVASFNSLAAATAADAKRVRRFVRPPQPLPTNLYGQQPSPFQFTSLDGQPFPIGPGKITVLLWYVDHPACRASVEQFEQVRLAFAAREQVQFLAVSVAPPDVTTADIQALLNEWRVAAPTARDLSATGRDVFAIDALPALVVLDAEGRVQVFEVSFNPLLAEQLPRAIEELLAGGDLAAQVLAQVHNDATSSWPSRPVVLVKLPIAAWGRRHTTSSAARLLEPGSGAG